MENVHKPIERFQHDCVSALKCVVSNQTKENVKILAKSIIFYLIWFLKKMQMMNEMPDAEAQQWRKRGGGGDWFRGWRKGMNIDHSLVREEIKLLTDQRYGRVELWVLFHRKKRHAANIIVQGIDQEMCVREVGEAKLFTERGGKWKNVFMLSIIRRCADCGYYNDSIVQMDRPFYQSY